MVQTRSVAKRQKIEECKPCMELVMFNSDSLFKIASYLPADGLLNLALTCRQFGIGDDSSLSLVEDTARRIVHDIATEGQRNSLPRYDGENWLSKYNYLQLLQMPLTFDQIAERQIEYVEGNKSRVANHGISGSWATAFSNNIMMAGRHNASFECNGPAYGFLLGVMRPGEAMQSAQGDPLESPFYDHFTQRKESRQYNNSVSCCMYNSFNGSRWSSDWEPNSISSIQNWEGMESISSPGKIGMLLDLDEGTLSVYNNGRKLGVMKRGLAGHYCWVVSLLGGSQVSIKRGPVPES